MIFSQVVTHGRLFSPYFFFFISLFIFFTGLSVGSFLNVVIFRLPKKSSVIYPPSSCPHCGSKIKFYDNIPVLSYIILSGRCRKCGYKISPMYPIVELLTALVFYLLFLKYFYNTYFFYKINILNIPYFKNYMWAHFDYFIMYAIFIFLIIPIAFIDLFHQIIPDTLNVLLIVSGFALNILLAHKSLLFPLYGFLGAGLFFYLIAFFYEIIKKKEGLGGGDIKLIAGIGSYIGLKGAIFTIFSGSVFALIFFIFIFGLRRIKKNAIFKASKRVEGADTNSCRPALNGNFKMPFGPFLSLASVFYLFYGAALMEIYLNSVRHG